ncbi:MAG: HAD-IA family hydrolase [Rhodobacteraceae bacterium]|nr:HAD-IA family hydrolase [Paracoccaceae bacterium]
MTRPAAVVFDIGNVLIEWQPERYYDRVIGETRRRALFDTVDLHKMNDRIDMGADFAATVAETAAEYPDQADAIRMWHDNWLDMAQPVIPQSVALLRRLRAKGVPVFALTNFGIGTFDLARTRYDFLDEFDRAYVSGHMAVTKPAPRIYEMVEQDSGLPPGALLFADDRPENIAAAAARGWQTHLFDGPEGWAKRLVAEGLLTEGEAA